MIEWQSMLFSSTVHVIDLVFVVRKVAKAKLPLFSKLLPNPIDVNIIHLANFRISWIVTQDLYSF